MRRTLREAARHVPGLLGDLIGIACLAFLLFIALWAPHIFGG